MMTGLIRRVSTGIVLCALALHITTAYGSETPKVVFPAWSQFGEITMHYASPDTNEQMFVRFVVHDNWDLLVELHQRSLVKKLIQLQLENVAVYYGLTEEELSSPAKSPFMFAGYVLAPAIGPLMKAFPDGIEQIPYSETPFSGIYENRSFKGTVIRTSVDAIRYDITMSEGGHERSFQCYGTWRSAKASSLPDEFSLLGWQLQSGSMAKMQSVRTLGELRKAKAN